MTCAKHPQALHQAGVSSQAMMGVNRAVIANLVKLHGESHLAIRLPAYDGRKSLYTAGALLFTSKEFKLLLTKTMVQVLRDVSAGKAVRSTRSSAGCGQCFT